MFGLNKEEEQKFELEEIPVAGFDILKAEEQDQTEFIEIFKRAYETMTVPENEEAWFKDDLSKSFTEQRGGAYEFYKIIDKETGKIVSFGAVSALPFTRGSWVLRWGTTDPEYQGCGLISWLTQFRVNVGQSRTVGMAGNVQVMARRPNIYKRLGFKPIYRRGPENDATHLVLVINQALDILEQE